MTSREALHRLVDELPKNHADLARQILEDLRDASDTNGEPLTPEALASLDRGLADIKAGWVKPLDQYKRERGIELPHRPGGLGREAARPDGPPHGTPDAGAHGSTG